MDMKWQRLLWNLMLKLPAFIKAPLIRYLVQYPQDISDTLRFKIAETQEELDQAFKLLHDSYVSENLMTPHPSGLRVTKYHALPSTSTLIAIENDVVVGTLSLIRQSSFGLPLETIFNIDCVPPSARIAEVSSLAIRKDFLHQRGRILFPLLKFLYHYGHEYFGVTHFVIAVNPKWIDFYTNILMFKPLSKKMVENYSFVNGAPAVGGILDLNLAQKVYYQIYHKKSLKRNLSAFFQDLEAKNMEFPLRKRSVISDPILSPQLLEHFFIKKTNCLETFTEYELSVLRELYNHTDYLNLIPVPKVVSMKKSRKEKRFETQIQGRLLGQNKLSTRVLIRDVGKKGLGGLLKSQAIQPGLCKILVNIEENQPCEVEGEFTWNTPEGYFGFKILKAHSDWTDFIQSLDQRLMKTEIAEDTVTKKSQTS